MHLKYIKPFFQRVFLVLIFLVVLGPFVWCGLISLQGTPEVNSSYALLLPREFRLDNYLAVITNSSVAQGFITQRFFQ